MASAQKLQLGHDGGGPVWNHLSTHAGSGEAVPRAPESCTRHGRCIDCDFSLSDCRRAAIDRSELNAFLGLSCPNALKCPRCTGPMWRRGCQSGRSAPATGSLWLRLNCLCLPATQGRPRSGTRHLGFGQGFGSQVVSMPLSHSGGGAAGLRVRGPPQGP